MQIIANNKKIHYTVMSHPRTKDKLKCLLDYRNNKDINFVDWVEGRTQILREAKIVSKVSKKWTDQSQSKQ